MRTLVLFLLSVWLVAGSAFAQQSRTAQVDAAVDAVLSRLQANAAQHRLVADDVAQVVVTDAYTSRHNGVTHVYVRQALGGLEIINAVGNASVRANGEVVTLHTTFVSVDAAQRRRVPVAALSAEAAVQAAARHLGARVPDDLMVQERAAGPAQAVTFTSAMSNEPISARLVYVATDGALRLAWDIALAERDRPHWWNARIDAETGALLDHADWTAHCHLPMPHSHATATPAVTPAVPLVLQAAAAPAVPLAAASAQIGSYRVIRFPAESPNHGTIDLVGSPADPVASPRGWHATSAASYTTTRGNNVWAYEDRGNRDRAGYSPDGGSGLLFDFASDYAGDNTLDAITYQDFIITNLFYWSNLYHDILWHYGFDEAAGNFQETNAPGVGSGNDAVRAEVQDGSGVNNANFGTPPDGQAPRMQMYIWELASFEVTAPSAIAKTYPAAPASFGAVLTGPGTSGEVVQALSGNGSFRGCAPFSNAAALTGKVALIERGDCNFVDKARNAQAAGAIAVIVYNNDRTGPGESGSPEDLVNMGLPEGEEDGALVRIPALFVQRSTGLLLRTTATPGVFMNRLTRDSSLDNGISVHEYTHGLSTRLTGGPSNSSCLSGFTDQNGNEVGVVEQMGEGWSDWYALMMTMTSSDVATRGRGIATYADFQDIDGRGIRNARYSTDFAVNDYTYSDIANISGPRFTSVPHGVGFVWATMLWDMTWLLIDRYGFDPDLIGGTGGNNIALQLVTDALKLQPCEPGFVDGRDAILQADQLTYGGANQDLIWRAFARRGLGENAVQGSSRNRRDGTADFTVPEQYVADEGPAASLPEGYRLTDLYPNPFNPQARFTLEVAQQQPVRLAVYDLLGRRVQTLHDGPLAAGTVHTFTLDGQGLSSGVYLIRAEGETFRQTLRATLLK